MPVVPLAPQPVRDFLVSYYAKTPKGTRSRFYVRMGISQIDNARSESAVYNFLRRRHPQCEIQIQTLDFK